MKIRGTHTDNLADVIQTLLLVRKTGILTVQRDGPGNSVETGVISLHNGQVTDASVGALRGGDAFKKLSSWTTCSFVFQATTSPTLPAQAAPPPAPPVPPSPRVPPRNSGAYPSVRQRQGTGEDMLSAVVPYRTPQFQGSAPDWQQANLPRGHRQLFLLIDGNRSVADLLRLTGRHPQELLTMLSELESVGLIRW